MAAWRCRSALEPRSRNAWTLARIAAMSPRTPPTTARVPFDPSDCQTPTADEPASPARTAVGTPTAKLAYWARRAASSWMSRLRDTWSCQPRSSSSTVLGSNTFCVLGFLPRSVGRWSAMPLRRERSGVSDPRVQVGVDDVDDQVHQGDGEGDDHGDGQDRRQVALEHRVDRPLADALEVEDRLGDHRASQQRAQVQADQVHHRGEAGAHAVLEDDLPLRQPFDPGGADVVLTHRLDQVAA